MIDMGGNKKTDDHPVAAEAAWPARSAGVARRREIRKERMGRASVVLVLCMALLLLVLLLGGRGGAPAVWQSAAKLTAMCGGTDLCLLLL